MKDESKEALQRFPNPEVDEGIKGNAMPKEKENLISDISLIENSNLIREKSKFEVRGEEMIEKEVRQSGNTGRVIFPQTGWGNV